MQNAHAEVEPHAVARTLLGVLKERNAVSLRLLLTFSAALKHSRLLARISPAPAVLSQLGSPLDSIGAPLDRRFGAG